MLVHNTDPLLCPGPWCQPRLGHSPLRNHPCALCHPPIRFFQPLLWLLQFLSIPYLHLIPDLSHSLTPSYPLCPVPLCGPCFCPSPTPPVAASDQCVGVQKLYCNAEMADRLVVIAEDSSQEVCGHQGDHSPTHKMSSLPAFLPIHQPPRVGGNCLAGSFVLIARHARWHIGTVRHGQLQVLHACRLGRLCRGFGFRVRLG